VIDDLLAGNRRFVAGEFNQHLDYYRGIAQGQSPTTLWIGCSDSRVSEHVLTGSKPGTIFVHRNIANIVAFNDVNIAAIVEYALVHLKIRDIVVCGHTRCGGVAAIEDGVAENYIADWLLIASGAKEKVDRMAKDKALTREEKLNLLVEENVRLQIKHLRQFALVKNLERKGERVRTHAWVYAVETGTNKTLTDGDRRRSARRVADPPGPANAGCTAPHARRHDLLRRRPRDERVGLAFQALSPGPLSASPTASVISASRKSSRNCQTATSRA
jgi:carbonic anhydrase